MNRWLKLCVALAMIAAGSLSLTACAGSSCCRGHLGPCLSCG